jgi:hypothetical protein
MKELTIAIGTKNVGIQLGSWHVLNAEEADNDLLALRGSDVVDSGGSDRIKWLLLCWRVNYGDSSGIS